MNNDILVDTENASILASSALLVSDLVGKIVVGTTSVPASINGDLLKPDAVEEMVLSRLQNKLIRKGD